MNFDFDNIEKYTQLTVEQLQKIERLEASIDITKLKANEIKFIGDVKQKIAQDRKLTDRQKAWLVSIIKKCKNI